MVSKESDLIIHLAEKQLRRLNDSLQSFQNKIDLEDSILNDDTNVYNMPMINASSLPEFDNVFEHESGYSQYNSLNQRLSSNTKNVSRHSKSDYPQIISSYSNLSQKSHINASKYTKGGLRNLGQSNCSNKNTQIPEHSAQKPRTNSVCNNNLIRDWRHGYKLVRENLGPMPISSSRSYKNENMTNDVTKKCQKQKLSTFWDWDINRKSERYRQSSKSRENEYKQGVRLVESRAHSRSNHTPMTNLAIKDNKTRSTTRTKSEIRRYIRERDKQRRQKQKEEQQQQHQHERRHRSRNSHMQHRPHETLEKYLPNSSCVSKMGDIVRKKKSTEPKNKISPKKYVKKPWRNELEETGHMYPDSYLNNTMPRTYRRSRHKSSSFYSNNSPNRGSIEPVIPLNTTIDSGIGTGEWTMNQPSKKQRHIQHKKPNYDDDNLNKSNSKLKELRILAEQAESGNPKKENKYYELLTKMYEDKITAYDNDSSDTDLLASEQFSDDGEYKEFPDNVPNDNFDQGDVSVFGENESENDLVDDSHCTMNNQNKSDTSRDDQYNHMSTPSYEQGDRETTDNADGGDDGDDDGDDDSSSLAKELRNALLEAQSQLELPMPQGKSLDELYKKIYKAVHHFIETKNRHRNSIQTQVSQSLAESNHIEIASNQPKNCQQKTLVAQQNTTSDEEYLEQLDYSDQEKNVNAEVHIVTETQQTEQCQNLKSTVSKSLSQDKLSDNINAEFKPKESNDEIGRQQLENPKILDDDKLLKDELLIEPEDVCLQKQEELLKYYEINMENLQTKSKHMSNRRDRANLLISLTKQYKHEADKVKRLEKKAFHMTRKLLPSQSKHSDNNQKSPLPVSSSHLSYLPPRHSVPPDGLEADYALSPRTHKAQSTAVSMHPPNASYAKSGDQSAVPYNNINYPHQQPHELHSHGALLNLTSDSDDHTLTCMSELTSTLSDQSDLDAQIIALKAELDKKKNLIYNLKRKRKELKRELIQSKERALEKQIELCDNQVKKLQENLNDLEQYNATDMNSLILSNSSHKANTLSGSKFQIDDIKSDEDSQKTDDNDDTLKEDIVSEHINRQNNDANCATKLDQSKILYEQLVNEHTESEEIVSDQEVLSLSMLETNVNYKTEPINTEKLENHEKCEISGLNGDHEKEKDVIQTSDIDAESITEEITIEKDFDDDMKVYDFNFNDNQKEPDHIQFPTDRRNTLEDLELINLDSDEGFNTKQNDLDLKPISKQVVEEHVVSEHNDDDIHLDNDGNAKSINKDEIDDELEEDSLDTSMRRNPYIIMNDDDFDDRNEVADDERDEEEEQEVLEEEILPEPPKRKHKPAMKLPADTEDTRKQYKPQVVNKLIDDIIDKFLEDEMEFIMQNIVHVKHGDLHNPPDEIIEDIQELSDDEQMDLEASALAATSSSSPDIEYVSIDDRIKWFLPIQRDHVSPVINEAIDLLYKSVEKFTNNNGVQNMDNLAAQLDQDVDIYKLMEKEPESGDAYFKQEDLLLARAQLLRGPATLDQLKLKNTPPSKILESCVIDRRAIFMLTKEIFLDIYSPQRLKAAAAIAKPSDQSTLSKPWFHPSATIRCQNNSLWKGDTPPENKELVSKIVYSELENILSRFYESKDTPSHNINSYLVPSLSTLTHQNRVSSLESKTGSKQLSRMIQWCLNKQKDDIDRLLVNEMRVEDSDWVFYDEAEELVKVQVANDICSMLMSDTASWLNDLEKNQVISIKLSNL